MTKENKKKETIMTKEEKVWDLLDYIQSEVQQHPYWWIQEGFLEDVKNKKLPRIKALVKEVEEKLKE
jgi:patatin-like phospholipase/acyl hydrolase